MTPEQGGAGPTGGGEFALIRRILAERRLVPEAVTVDAGDDCAVFAAAPLAVGNDLSVDGVHFRRDWLSPVEIGFRAASAALSDLAAMAAEPIAVLLALCLDEGTDLEDALALARGVIRAAEAVGAGLAGGDITRGPTLALDVVAVGRCPAPVRRGGARAGDRLWVTGRLGGAARAVRAWRDDSEPAPAARAAFAAPRPRVAEARWLAERGARALIDLSDGLAGDCAHLAGASGLKAVLDGPAIPLDEGAGAGPEDALHGGEDYELLLAAPPGALEDAASAFQDRFHVRLTPIGVVRAGTGVYLRDADGRERPLARGGFDHLGGTSA